MDNISLQTDSASAIVVVGSLNMDLVITTPRIPNGGETLSGHTFQAIAGGKGANQAVACARLGAPVSMIGQVGTDAFGDTLCHGLQQDHVITDGILRTTTAPTGVAMILVEDNGENRIILAGGANATLRVEDIQVQVATLQKAAMLIVQMEIPLPVVVRAIEIAHAANVPVLCNPAPAMALPDAVWPQIDLLVPNESEASLLSGVTVQDTASAIEAGKRLIQKGVRHVVITLGRQGVVKVTPHETRHFPAHIVAALDTTAAGDTFVGGLAAGLKEGMTLDQAIELGQQASAISVTRLGAQTSIPYRHEISGFNVNNPKP